MSGNMPGRVFKGELYEHRFPKSELSLKTETKSYETALYINANN